MEEPVPEGGGGVVSREAAVVGPDGGAEVTFHVVALAIGFREDGGDIAEAVGTDCSAESLQFREDGGVDMAELGEPADFRDAMGTAARGDAFGTREVDELGVLVESREVEGWSRDEALEDQWERELWQVAGDVLGGEKAEDAAAAP